MTGLAVVGAGLAFSFDLPTRIRFGRGVRMATGEVTVALGRRPALVAGRSFDQNPVTPALLDSLDTAGAAPIIRVLVAGEPDDAAVLAAARAFREADVDVVVAVGGGSALDLAKAAALLPDRDQLAEWLSGERVDQERGLPVVAMPTTAGSGAEVSHAAIVLDRQVRRKRGVRGRAVAAAVALVDPEIAACAPASVTAASGFDAIAHAVETSASKAASDLVIRLAAVALPHLLDAVPAAMADPNNLEARDVAAYGALLMGANLANSTTCLPHRLQYPVGAATATSHADGVAALTPAWLARTVEVAPEALARLAVAAGFSDPGEPPGAAAAGLAERVIRHLQETAMPTSLADLGVRARDVPALVRAVEGSVANDPGPVAPDDLADLYLASLDRGDRGWTR